MLKRISRDEHPNTLESMTNHAISYFRLGQHPEAMSLNKQTLEMQKRILSKEYPYTLESMDHLTLSYFHLGQHQEAMHLNKQTLEMRKRILGDTIVRSRE